MTALVPKAKLPWILLVCSSILFSDNTRISAFRFPNQTGPYITGVQDMEFTDTSYPSNFAADHDGRRIMFRVWYPVCDRSDSSCSSMAIEDSGRRRRYFEPGEWEAFFGSDEQLEVTATFDLTHSYLNAPPLQSERVDDFPTVLYTHGFGMYFSDNTILLEEIASHGYTVFALSSPGFTQGTQFPNNDTVSAIPTYSDLYEIVANASAPSPYDPPYSSDLQVRFDAMKTYLEDTQGGIPVVFPRMRDDLLALADYLHYESMDGNSPIQALVGDSGLAKVLYMGFSLGGAAASSAAQKDPRAVGAINMDGGHQSLDLFATESLVPVLAFTGIDDLMPYYYNEMFYEKLESMGSSPTVARARAPGRHLDFTDYKLLDQPIRQAFGFNHTVDGNGFHAALSHFCLGFIDTYLGAKRSDWSPQLSFDQLSSVDTVNVSYVADWAQQTQEIPADGDHASAAASRGWASLALIGFLIFASFLGGAYLHVY